MRSGWTWLCVWVSWFSAAQDQDAQARIDRFSKCQTLGCQLSEAVRIAEFYVETDHMDKAQQWIDYAKKLHQMHPSDSLSFFLSSLQSETFYYMELYQFGIHEAEKAIEKAAVLRDSAFLSDGHFFKGIHQIEISQVPQAQESLWRALKFHPKRTRKHLRTVIGEAYICNNLAQVKLKIREIDSALFYNRKAYATANAHRNFRGIVNAEQTFGLIYAAERKPDSARFYLAKSTASAEKYELHDVAMLNCAYLMGWYLDDPAKVHQLYQKGLSIIARYEINNSYERYFYATALEVFKKLGDEQQILALQQKIIGVNQDTNDRARHFTQNIIEQYMKNENKLLVSKIIELRQARNIAILQLVAVLSGFLVLLFVALFFRRKNKLQKLLLDQKNEISKDLHDDIGSELSSILINANLLLRTETDGTRKALLARISHTGTEISQRLHAFIWSLNTENNSVRSFCEYIRQYAENLLDSTDITLHYTDNIAFIEHKPLNGYLRKNLFFCIKEALNNAVRHSGASSVALSVIAHGKMLQISIADDGIGISGENTFGNGFKNMAKRAESLKGTARFENQSGLTVVLSIPI